MACTRQGVCMCYKRMCSNEQHGCRNVSQKEVVRGVVTRASGLRALGAHLNALAPSFVLGRGDAGEELLPGADTAAQRQQYGTGGTVLLNSNQEGLRAHVVPSASPVKCNLKLQP